MVKMGSKMKILNIRENEKKALIELKEKLSSIFKSVKIILFGSKARGDFDKESDIDILILLDCPITSKIEENVSEIAYEIELKYGVVFGKIIENTNYWNNSRNKCTPLYQSIEKEGFQI